jgi:hypothetical protein
VLLLLVELRRVVERVGLAVDPGPGEALRLELAEQLDVLALAAADHRRQHLEPRPSSRLRTRSTICCGVCRSIGAPQVGQCGRPARA